MNRRRWILWIAIVGLIAFLAAGCSNQVSQDIDPPQKDYELDVEETMAETVDLTESEQLEKMNVSLYFKDASGYVVPINVEMPSVESVARQALQYMTVNGPMANMLSQDFTAMIPEGTSVLGMDIKASEKLAIVDFSKEFRDYEAKDERKILEAITWTLTEFPTIDQVKIWVEGAMLKEMPVAGTPLDEPLSRAMGINIERENGVNLGQSTPVTLYFQSQTVDHESYFVPVTRMIERTDDIALASIEQLISGPLGNTNLVPVMVSDVDVLKIEQYEDLITVHLSDDIFDANHKAPTESLQSVILSLTESIGVAKVQIMVDNNIEVTSTDDTNYSQPALRPTHINSIEM